MPPFLFGALIANGQSVVHAALFAVPFAIGLVWLYLEVQSTVTVDDQKIVYHRIGRRISIPWSEVDEFHYSPRLMSIGSARRRARMKFFRDDYGASFEPFDGLRAAVQRRVERRLTESWERISLPVKYRYRGLSAATVWVYIVALGIALLFPVLIAFSEGAFGIGTAAFLIVCVAPIVPFFVRDYARTHGVLVIDRDGVRKTNGKRVSIPWPEVSRLVVREPTSIGWGSVTIEASGGRAIWMPRWLPEIGAILYLVRKHSDASEVYGHEI
jgi:hypothetical protein